MNVLSAYFGIIVDNDVKMEARKGSMSKKSESIAFISFKIEEGIHAVNFTEENRSVICHQIKERWILLSVDSQQPPQDTFVHILFSMAHFIKSKYYRQIAFKEMRDNIIRHIMESYRQEINMDSLREDDVLKHLFLIIINEGKCYLFIDMLWLEFYRIITSLYLNGYTSLPVNPIFAKYFIHASKPITNFHFNNHSSKNRKNQVIIDKNSVHFYGSEMSKKMVPTTKNMNIVTIMENIRKWVALYWFIKNIVDIKNMKNVNIESFMLDPFNDSFDHYDFLFSYKQNTYYKIKKIVTKYFEKKQKPFSDGNDIISNSTESLRVENSSPNKRKLDQIQIEEPQTPTKRLKKDKPINENTKIPGASELKIHLVDSPRTITTKIQKTENFDKKMVEFFISAIFIKSNRFVGYDMFQSLYNDFFPKIKYLPEKVCEHDDKIDFAQNLQMEKRSMELIKRFPDLAITLYILKIFGVIDEGLIAIEAPKNKILKQFQSSLKDKKASLSMKIHGMVQNESIYISERICTSMLNSMSNTETQQFSQSRSFDFIEHFINQDLDMVNNTYMVLSFYGFCREHLNYNVDFYSKEQIDEVLFSLQIKLDIIKKDGPEKELDGNYLFNCVKHNINSSDIESKYKDHLQSFYEKHDIINNPHPYITEKGPNSTTDATNKIGTSQSSDIHVWFANVETKKHIQANDKSSVYHNHNVFLIKDDLWDSSALMLFNHKKKSHDEYCNIYNRYIHILKSQNPE